MPIGVYRIFLGQAWTDAETRVKLLATLDALPSFLYRIDRALEADLADAGGDEVALASHLRVAMTQSHVALIPAASTGTDESLTRLEIELARTGFRRRIPVLAVVAPGQKPDPGQRVPGADRITAFDGVEIGSAIQELAEAAAAERRGADLTRRPKSTGQSPIADARSAASAAALLRERPAARQLPFAEITEAFICFQTARGQGACGK